MHCHVTPSHLGGSGSTGSTEPEAVPDSNPQRSTPASAGSIFYPRGPTVSPQQCHVLGDKHETPELELGLCSSRTRRPPIMLLESAALVVSEQSWPAEPHDLS